MTARAPYDQRNVDAYVADSSVSESDASADQALGRRGEANGQRQVGQRFGEAQGRIAEHRHDPLAAIQVQGLEPDPSPGQVLEGPVQTTIVKSSDSEDSE